ncbi:hypothetical protein APHAL10511_001372 [Amanita phalloides]|nr:hypothetical protein APHAL10511_001372 [Amanita phalloides]
MAMRFIKSLSLHKRTLSEPLPGPDGFPRSVVIEKAYNDLFAPENPSLRSPQCRDVDLEILNLKRLSSNWASSHSRLVYDLNLTQSELLLERERNKGLRRQLHTQSELVEDMKRSLDRLQHFISILGEIGMCDDIVANAYASISEGRGAVDALVEAIKEAASVPGSNWAIILPAVSGPRTQAEYVAALHLSLNVRRELRKCKKVAKFWKNIAQQYILPSTMVTPSVSVLSSIYEKIPPERQDAVNALMERRKKDIWNGAQCSGRKLGCPISGHPESLVQMLPESADSRPNETTVKELQCSVIVDVVENPVALTPTSVLSVEVGYIISG